MLDWLQLPAINHISHELIALGRNLDILAKVTFYQPSSYWFRVRLELTFHNPCFVYVSSIWFFPAQPKTICFQLACVPTDLLILCVDLVAHDPDNLGQTTTVRSAVESRLTCVCYVLIWTPLRTTVKAEGNQKKMKREIGGGGVKRYIKLINCFSGLID